MQKSDKHPASTKRVLFRTQFVKDPDTGDWVSGWHEGFFLKDANKYVKNICRWKDCNEHRWYDDKDVIEWKEQDYD